MTTRILAVLETLVRHYAAAAGRIDGALEGWFLGLAARLTFAAVLFGYYWTSALTKISEGPLGVFDLTAGAYIQIVPWAMEAAGYDDSAIGFVPWGAVVAAGTYAEFLLPILLVLGLATRLTALSMIGFIAVQSWVDLRFHGADAATLGALFDRLPSAAILDQRLLWVFLLSVLVAKGAGALSVDHLIARASATRLRAA
jgi:putative oxidoreductase